MSTRPTTQNTFGHCTAGLLYACLQTCSSSGSSETDRHKRSTTCPGTIFATKVFMIIATSHQRHFGKFTKVTQPWKTQSGYMWIPKPKEHGKRFKSLAPSFTELLQKSATRALERACLMSLVNLDVICPVMAWRRCTASR